MHGLRYDLRIIKTHAVHLTLENYAFIVERHWPTHKQIANLKYGNISQFYPQAAAQRMPVGASEKNNNALVSSCSIFWYKIKKAHEHRK